MFRFLKLFFITLFFGIYSSGNALFEIVEVMPNTLDDKNLEYITLKNISDSSQSLSGYTLADKSKSYTFSDDIFLQSGEREQFFRPQTKLVLNNSDEEIYLYNKNGEKIDEVSYAVSVKSEFLTFEEITQGEEDIISQEAYISGEIFISDEVIIEENVDVVEEVLISPEIIFSLQRPSYITQSGSTDIYTCDRDECKVNFDLGESFSNELPEKDYECDIDFGIQGLTGQEGRCNPNTVTFPKGEFEVKIKIWHESNAEIFTEKVIFIHNPEFQYIETLDVSNNLGGGGSESDLSTLGGEELILEKLYIHKPRIIVQSGLIGEGRYFYCEKTECKINLNYEKKHKDERCFWHFANMQQSSSSTHTRCNPGYVTVKPGTHKMFLRAYEDDNEDNRKTTRFYIYNEERIEKFSLSGNLSQLSTQGRMEQKIEIPQIKINLQGQISHEKSLSGSTLTCEGVEKCYVNLEGIWEGSSEGEYSWLLNGEQFSQKLNPKGIWIEGPGNHEIILRVGDTQESFYVEITTLVFSLTRIQEISNGREMEQGEIKDTESKIDFTQNFLPLKYDGLRISGKALTGSKVEIYSAGNKILSGVSDEKGKYRLVSKDFSSGDYIFDTKIILESGEEVLLEASGEYTLLPEKRSNWFISKTTKKSSSSKAQKVIAPPKLLLKAAASDEYYREEEHELQLGEKILLILIVIFVAIFGVLHLLFIQMKNMPKNIFSLYSLRFSTRQRVCLILG